MKIGFNARPSSWSKPRWNDWSSVICCLVGRQEVVTAGTQTSRQHGDFKRDLLFLNVENSERVSVSRFKLHSESKCDLGTQQNKISFTSIRVQNHTFSVKLSLCFYFEMSDLKCYSKSVFGRLEHSELVLDDNFMSTKCQMKWFFNLF